MAKLHTGNKENLDLEPSGNKVLLDSISDSALKCERVRALDFKRKLHNECRKWVRAEHSKAEFRAQAADALNTLAKTRDDLARNSAQIETLKREKHTLFMRDYRALEKKQRAVEKSQTVQLKEKGIIAEASREMVRNLTSHCNVPVARINSVIQTVSQGLGIAVTDSIDKHSVSRITLEGQVASEIQLVSEIHEAGSKTSYLCIISHFIIRNTDLTISGDGTTDKHLNYESKHGMILTPTYSSNPNAPAMNTMPCQRFFGINAAIDHKSETQLQGWKDLIERMYKVYDERPLGQRKPLNSLEFPRFVTGMNTDHAEDQKKLVRLFKTWKAACECEMRGEEALLSASLAELIPLLVEETEQNITDAGGHAAWEALPPDERERREVATYHRLCMRVGEDKLDTMTPEERRHVALFIWGGCCMHKEMNSVKGGNTRMMAFWAQNGLVAPMKLYNRDNSAAASLGGSEARTRAAEVSQAGGVKLTSLAGAVFAHKDKKKGQQDSLQVYLQSVVGYMVCFPGTSSTRYGSTCEAAAELLV